MASFWRRKKTDPFSTSVLGLDKSIEELKAQEDKVKRMWDRMNDKTKKDEGSEKHD